MDENDKVKFEYCRDLVRREDPDRYLLSMFAPVEHRQALWTVFAYNIELAKTRDVVTETSIGLMRLLWWREAAAQAYNAVQNDGVLRENPIVEAMSAIMRDYNLPLKPFEDMAYGREFDLEDIQPGNMLGLINYCDFVHTPLMELVVAVLGVDAPHKNLGVGYSLTGILRSHVAYIRQRRCYLPQDLCTKHELSERDLYEFKNTPALQNVTAEIVTVVKRKLDDVKLNHAVFKAMNALTHMYLKQIESVENNLLNPKLITPPALKTLRVWLKTF